MENKIYGRIYLIKNLTNGKMYIGQTVKKISLRFSEHCSNAKKEKDLGMIITRAIKKYGKENFTIEEIDVAYNQKQLNLLEGIYISWFNTLKPNGYNLTHIINGKGKPNKTIIEKIRKTANKPENLIKSSENGKKRRGRKTNFKSKYVGISISGSKYRAIIGHNHKNIKIGTYNTEIDAAKARDIEAIKLYGNDAILNFPELREDYINNKIFIKKNSINHQIKSGEKNIYYCKRDKLWQYKWYDNIESKMKSKTFKLLNDAIKFKYKRCSLDKNFHYDLNKQN